MRTNVGLTVEALAVAVEADPTYLAVGQYPDDPEELQTLLDGRAAPVTDGLAEPIKRLAADEVASMIDFVVTAVTYTNIPRDVVRMLLLREDGVELAELALATLGAPPRPQPLLLVQASCDRDTPAMLLPKLVHELDWYVTEELGITHLGALGGTAILDMLSWSVDPHAGATAVVADQPHFVAADQVPEQISAVALRFGADGALQVLDWGEGRPPADSGRRFSGPGACGGWLALHAALGRGELRTGDPIAVQSRAGDRLGWALLRFRGESGGRPVWWRPPRRVGNSA